jgi:membrane-bound serine protease (ClpP class)
LENLSSIVLAFGLFLAGFACVAVEVFVIPGFGFVGILGGVLLIADIVYAWIYLGPMGGLVVLVASLGCTIASVWVMMNTRVGKRFRLERNLKGSASAVSVGREELVGRTGVALSPLRPSGVALIGEERIDVSADGAFIDKGTKIRVIEVEGPRIVVESTEEGGG